MVANMARSSLWGGGAFQSPVASHVCQALGLRRSAVPGMAEVETIQLPLQPIERPMAGRRDLPVGRRGREAAGLGDHLAALGLAVRARAAGAREPARRGTEAVVISLGAQRAVGVQGERAWLALPPEVKRRSTVGS